MELSLDLIEIIFHFNPKSFCNVNKYFTDYYLKLNKSASIIQKVYKKWKENKFESYSHLYIPLHGININTSIYDPFIFNYNITITLPPILNFEEKIKNNNKKKIKHKKFTKNKKFNRINKKRNNYKKKIKNFSFKR